MLEVHVEENKNEQKGTENAGKNASWMIYGAYGYVGRLILQKAVDRKVKELQLGITNGLPLPILAGRSSEMLTILVESVKLPPSLEFVVRVFNLDNASQLDKGLEGVAAVLNCAGPFVWSAPLFIDACLRTKTHYLDLSGEWKALEYVMSKGNDACISDIVLIPGVGFDIVPTDCLISMLYAKLPGATHLETGILGMDSMSKGTMKSGVELLADGGKARIEGEIKTVPFVWQQKTIDFPGGPQHSVSVPWGDVSTGFYSSGISNITCYKAVSPYMASWLNGYTVSFFSYLSSYYYIKSFFETVIEYAAYEGPSQEYRDANHSEFWAKIWNKHTGEYAEGSIVAPEAYKFTADSALSAVVNLLTVPRSVALKGALTPSSAFGAEFVSSLQGVSVYPIRFVESTNVISPFRRHDEEEEVAIPTMETGEIPSELIPEQMKAYAPAPIDNTETATPVANEGALVDVKLHAVQEPAQPLENEADNQNVQEVKPEEVEQHQADQNPDNL